MRGEPDVLLGERGGAVPAGNMEGKGLLAAFGLEQFPGTFKGAPDLASFNNDVTYTISKGVIKTISPKHICYYILYSDQGEQTT